MNALDQILKLLNTELGNILQIHRFGSHVYGTVNDSSDKDYIVIVKEYTIGSTYKSDDIDLDIYDEITWNNMLLNNDVRAIETLYVEPIYNNILHNTNIEIIPSKLRKSFSTVYSGAWIKGKKKLIVASDYNKKLAIKSIFHSLRIVDFGLQIIQHNKIYDYSSMNYVLDDLYNLAEQYERVELWDKINSKYLGLFKTKKSVFKKLAPKVTTKSQYLEIIKKYNVKHNEVMFQELKNLFNEY